MDIRLPSIVTPTLGHRWPDLNVIDVWLYILKSVPKDRLLVKTNAPYIAPNGIRVNSPVYLGEVIEVVARQRHDRLEDVCRQACINAFAVFGQ